jgi:hypothetical protein
MNPCRAPVDKPCALRQNRPHAVDVSSSDLPVDEWLGDTLSNVHHRGTTEELATILRAYAAAGIQRVQVWLNPCTVAGHEAYAPVLDLLDAA